MSGERLLRRKKVFYIILYVLCKKNIKERDKEFEKRLDSKVKVAMYKIFGNINCMELMMLNQNFCLNLDQECMVNEQLGRHKERGAGYKCILHD